MLGYELFISRLLLLLLLLLLHCISFRRTEFHLIDDHVVETVPSSNPESVDSFLSDELFEPFDTLDDTMEVFEKEDLSEYGDEKVCNFI